MFDILKLITNAEYRGEVIAYIGERFLPTLLGVAIAIIGIAFILADSKAAKTVSGITEIVATKGASLVK